MKRNFEIIREIACKVGVTAPESDDEIYCAAFLSSINRSIGLIYKDMEQANARILELENSDAFTKYKTSPAESLVGIAHRELGDERFWVEIARLNSLAHPDMLPHDYFPVGACIILPKNYQAEMFLGHATKEQL